MQTEQSGDTNLKANGDPQLKASKTKRRPKKPKPTSTATPNNKNDTTANEGTITSSVKKKKKRNNNKKNTSVSEDKTENLISRTFKASKLQNSSSDESKESSLKDVHSGCVTNCGLTKATRLESKKDFGVSSNCNPLLDAIVKVEEEESHIGTNKNLKSQTPRIHNEQTNSSQKISKCNTTNSNKTNNKQNLSSCSRELQSNVESSDLSDKPKQSKPKKNKQNKGQATNLNKTHPSQDISPTQPTKEPAPDIKTTKNKIEKNTDKSAKVDNNTKEISNKKSQDTSAMESMQKEKDRNEIHAVREAKKLAKQQAKKAAKVNVNKKDSTTGDASDANSAVNKVNVNDTKLESIADPHKVSSANEQKAEKSREEILAEREARKLAKLMAKNKGKTKPADETKDINNTTIETEVKKVPEISVKDRNTNKVETMENLASDLKSMQIKDPEGQKKKAMTKAERRAIQEAQREAKANLLAGKQQIQKPVTAKKEDIKKKEVESEAVLSDARKGEKPSVTSPSKPRPFKVKFFNQLVAVEGKKQNFVVNDPQIHPVMIRLGEQYAKRIVVGSNARCIAFLNALKTVIQDYETPPKKEFSRSLEKCIKKCVDHLQNCRPLAVSVSNAYNYIKVVLTKLPPNQPESELKKHLVELIDIYVKDQIEKAAQAISYYVQESISNGDVILTYGCSSLITHILEEANQRSIDFRVIVVDSKPFSEGQELLRRLVSKGISCTCVLINAIGFVMPEVTKVLLGAHALLANGYVVSRIGTAQVALVAQSFNVSVFVCCEKHKFCERTQTDAIVYNELGNPNDLFSKTTNCRLMDWKSLPSLYPLNLNYDVTPPELVNVVVTEVTLMPSTSAPVILRIRPNEMLS